MGRAHQYTFLCEVVTRLLLLGLFLITEQLSPFTREIQPEELWLYKYHHVQRDHIPNTLIFSIALFTPLAAIMLVALLKHTDNDIIEASLASTLTLLLNGIFTNAIKLAVGSPTRREHTLDLCYGNITDGFSSRSFAPLGLADHNIICLLLLYRQELKCHKPQSYSAPQWLEDAIKQLLGSLACTNWDIFGGDLNNGQMNPDFNCSGSPDVVMDGRKSFPSAHSSFAFAGLGFTALYVAGKLHCFSIVGRGRAWRLCAFLTPLLCASLIALSRICDHKHHWQDVLVGALIGCGFSYLCYRQHYPAFNDSECHQPLLNSEPKHGRKKSF